MKKTELTKREVMNAEINEEFNYLNPQEIGFECILKFKIVFDKLEV